MKKDYIKPELEVLEMETFDMIATSVGIVEDAAQEDYENGGDAKETVFGFDAWE